MDNYEKLVSSLDEEMQAFKDLYKTMSTTQVYNDWYIISFYESYYDMLASDLVQCRLDDSAIAWLAEKESPLDYLYDKWMSSDGSLSLNWDEMLDFVVSTYIQDRAMSVPKDKIMVAILDDSYYETHGDYPAEYSREYAHEVYTFATPEEFVEKWYELPEGDWYWVFDEGEIICSGAIDPADIEIFEGHWGKSFENLSEDVDLPEKVTISAKTLALDTDDMYRDKKLMSDILSDYLSDVYGFCHKGFDFEVTFNEFNEPSDTIVTNIKWDVDIEESRSLDKQIETARSIVQESHENSSPGTKSRSENII